MDRCLLSSSLQLGRYAQGKICNRPRSVSGVPISENTDSPRFQAEIKLFCPGGGGGEHRQKAAMAIKTSAGAHAAAGILSCNFPHVLARPRPRSWLHRFWQQQCLQERQKGGLLASNELNAKSFRLCVCTLLYCEKDPRLDGPLLHKHTQRAVSCLLNGLLERERDLRHIVCVIQCSQSIGHKRANS